MDQQPVRPKGRIKVATAARRPTDSAANGVVDWPVKKCHVDLEKFGYKGWWVDLQINPIAEDWDKFLLVDSTNLDAIWEAFSAFFIAWNITDRSGKVLPAPPQTKRTKIPLDIPRILYTSYIDAVNKDAELPKESESNSSAT